MLAAVQDKVAATATLERLGLPQPPTNVLRNREAVDRFDEFPAFVKFPIGTACSGVGLAPSRAEVQSVSDQGELVGFHVNIRTREGARGGASHKRSVMSPATRHAIEELGNELGWHGALSADVILTGAGPQIIDINPRLVEPNNAWFAGVDLVELMLIGADADRGRPHGCHTTRHGNCGHTGATFGMDLVLEQQRLQLRHFAPGPARDHQPRRFLPRA